MTLETSLAEVLEWLFRTPPPAAVQRKAREKALDTFGCVIAGRRHAEVGAFAQSLEAMDPGSAASAAAAFAAAACWDEACEGLARAHGRPGISVLGALHALARSNRYTIDEVLAAYITGYEIGGRLGEVMRIGPGMHVDGYWPTLGVAAAVVRLRGGSAAHALAAIRIAACQLPNSLYLPVAAGANARNTYLSHAAQLGMLSASAALGGVVAPEGAVKGTAIAPVGEWLILEAYLKPYAAVRHVHYGAAVAQTLRAEIDYKKIKAIELSTYKEAVTYCGNRAPTTAIQAQFSLSYGVACMLVTGELGPDSYAMDNPEIARLEKMIVLSEDPALTGRGATLTVHVGDRKLEKKLEKVIGDPSMPMPREEILAKFARYAGRDGRDFLDAPGKDPFSVGFEYR